MGSSIVSSLNLPGLNIQDEVGRGASSVVFRASRGVDTVAVKVPRAFQRSFDTEQIRQFQREGSLLACLTHRALPDVYEVGTTDALPYIVLEYIEGDTLDERLDDGPLDLDELLELGIALGGALAELHARGLAHCDVTPHNILVDPEGEPRLIDFGLAYGWQPEGDDDREAAVGTLAYASPEQTGMLDRPVDGRSDLYELGAVLFHCETGHPPYDGETGTELKRRHANVPVPDPRESRRDLPERLARLIERLLAKEPADRPAGAQQVLTECHRCQTDDITTPRQLLQTATRTRFWSDQTFVGRRRPRRQLRDLWRESQTGKSRTALLFGAAGSGKTALVDSLLSEIQSEGALILEVEGLVEEPYPYAPIRRMLSPIFDYIESLGPDGRQLGRQVLDEAVGEYRQIVSSVLPEMQGSGDAGKELGEAVGSEEAYRGLASMIGALAEMAEGAILVVDDAHQLDEASREILERTAIQAADAPLMILALCDEEAPRRQRDQLESTLADHLDLDLRLGPMSPKAIEQLVRAQLADRPVDRRLVERITTLSHGNPYAATAYVRAVLDAAVLRPTWNGWEVDHAALETLDLPDELSALLVERIERLSEPALEVLTWISIFTTSAGIDRLAEATQMRHPRLQQAIGEVHRHRLVDVDASGRYELVHDEIRQSVLDRLTDGQLRTHHQTAAEVLDDGGDLSDQVYQVAYHYARGEVDEHAGRAYELNYQAGLLATERLANERAFEFLDRAHRIAEAHGLAPDIEFYKKFADLADRTSRLEVATEQFERALEQCDESIERAELFVRLAGVSMSGYDTPRGREYLEQGFAAIDEPYPESSSLRLLATAGQWLLGEWQTSEEAASSEEPTDRRLEVLRRLYALATLIAYFHMDKGLMAQADVQMLRLAQKSKNPASLAQAHSGHSVMLTVAGFADRGRRHIELAYQFAEQSDDPFAINSVDLSAALAADYQGEPLRAERLLRELLCQQPVMLETMEFLAGYNTLIQHFNMRGHFGESVAETDHARQLLEARFGDESRHLAVMFSLLTVAYTVLGREDHLERFERVVERHKPDPANRFHLGYYYAAKLATRVERGQWGEQTEQLVEEYRSLGYTPDNTTHYQAMFFISLGFLRLHQLEHDSEDVDSAVKQLDRALDDLEALSGTPVYRGYLKVFQAARARVTGDVDRARQRLRQAEEVADMYDIPMVRFEVVRNRALLMNQLDRPRARDCYLRWAVDFAGQHGWKTPLDRLRRQFVGMIDETLERSTFGTSATASRSTTALGKSWADEQMASLGDIEEILSSYGETADQLQESLEELCQLYGAQRAHLYSVDAESGLVRQAGSPGDGDPPGSDELPDRLARYVYRDQNALFLGPDDASHPPIEGLADSEIRSLLVVPIRFRDRISGILYLESRLADGVFELGDREFVQLVGQHLMLLVEHARATDLEDQLTSAKERSAALLEHATRAVQIGVATGTPQEASLSRASPTVHTMAEPWPSTADWWQELLETADWPEAHTCQTCRQPEHVGEMLADMTAPAVDGEPGERQVFEITSTGHGHELTERETEHILLVRNITDQYETNERLKEMNRQLKQARDEAMVASEAKSKFLARMSHEFRTPLNALVGYTELLLEDVDEDASEQLVRDLESIETSAHQLKRLIGDVLDLTKLDSGGLENDIQEVDLEELLEELTAKLEPMFEETNNELVVEADGLPVDLRTDGAKLRQVLVNLLRNAAKFTDGGTITLRIEELDAEEDRRLVFEVADNGIGMSEEEQAQIFEPFFQVDQSSTSDYRGTGLGLTLVRRFVERMDGEIDLESTPGVGTTVRVVLAADLQEASTPETPSSMVGTAPV